MRKRNYNYHYKSASLSAFDDIEHNLYQVVNDYGYNLGSERSQIIDYERIIKEPKYNFNRKYFNERK